MWITGNERMPSYGETVMYKIIKGKKIEEGICMLTKTDGSGHHFTIIAEMYQNGKEKQPTISMLDGKEFIIQNSNKGLLVWFDMIELNQDGLNGIRLIQNKLEEV